MSNEAQAYVASLKVGDLTAKFVLSRLADRADERFSCFPSVALLAAEAEKSERVVQRALAKLREMRLISDKERIRADGSTASSRYFLHGPWDSYGGTGVPFETITTPQQKRAEQWAEPPREGSFRPGTAAAEALAGKSSVPAAQGSEESASSAEQEKARTQMEQDAPAVPATKPAEKTPSKSSPVKKAGKVRMTKEQAAAVRAVEEAFPEQLQKLLPSYRPPVLRDAILQALESRTADQVAERVRRRWWAHGYAADVLPEGKGIGSPVGVAVGLVRPSTDCPDPMCEDGTTVDTGTTCRACAERRADWKADRHGQVPEPRQEPSQAASDWWECAECRNPYKGERPTDGLCSGCRAEAEAAAAAARRLREEFEQAEAERAQHAAEAWDAMLEEAYAEHADREQVAAELRAKRETAEQRRREDEEETRRLREQLAREYPELAAVSQP
jgi:Helix-turn-helix domain